MAGLIVDFEHDSLIGYFLVKSIVRLGNSSKSFDKLCQLFHRTPVIIHATDNVNEGVGFLLDIFIG